MGTIEVRYSRLYAVWVVLLALLFLLLAIINIFEGPDVVLVILFGIFGLVLLAARINLRHKTYLRIDKGKKKIAIHGIFGFISRNKNFDRLCYDGEKLYIEKAGMQKLLNILYYACNKKDLGRLIEEIGNNCE